MSDSAGTLPITWGAPATIDKALTTSYVASDAFEVRFAKRLTLYPLYKGGAGSTTNTAQIQVYANPFDAVTDPSGVYWHPIGLYSDTSGAMTEEQSTFNIAQTTAGTFRNGVAIDFDCSNAMQVKIQVKETVGAGSAGTVRVVCTKNTIN